MIDAWWSLLLIVFGSANILGRTVHRVPALAGNCLKILAVFGGVERHVAALAFRKGKVTAMFGRAKLNFRVAALANDPATINVLTLFRDTEITVPDDWSVRVDVLPIFGFSVDKRPRQGGPKHGEPDLIVTDAVAFGGVTIEDKGFYSLESSRGLVHRKIPFVGAEYSRPRSMRF
ncbi:MAG: hypothetical protein ACI9EZ_000565 [Halobacteriales archaeon]|jgi:hypothetical protein